ncbi:MAG: lipopolysaccharide biosynthesis protein [Halothiobacillaceae bacterium]
MKAPHARDSIARATISTSAVLVLRMIAQVGSLLLFAHLLGPESFSSFVGMASLAVTLGTLSTFGTHFLLLRETSCAPPNQPAKLLPLTLGTTLFSGSLLLAIYLFVTSQWLQQDNINLLALLAIGVSDIIALPLLQIPSAKLQGQGQIARSQLLLTLPLALRLLAVALILIWQPDNTLNMLALAYAAASLASLPFGLMLMQQDWPHLRDWRLPKRSEWRETSGFAALNLTAIAPNELDKTIAMQVLSPIDASTYAVGSRVMGPLVLPVLAMMLSTLPRLFREHGGSAQNNDLMRISLLAALGYGLLAAVALWFFAPWVAWPFGEQFAGLTETLRWLALAVPGLTLRYVVSNALMSQGRPWLRVIVESIGLLALGFAALQLTAFGSTGMALALACSEWTMALLGLFMLRRILVTPTART